MSDHELAGRLATEAGELLLGVRRKLADASAAERKDAGDKRAHAFLMEALAAERPDDAMLSEEATEEERANSKRLSAERVWIVDPLDGTREFGRARSRGLGGPRGAVAVRRARRGSRGATGSGRHAVDPRRAGPAARPGSTADRGLAHQAARRGVGGPRRARRRSRRDGFRRSEGRVRGPGGRRRLRPCGRPVRVGLRRSRRRRPCGGFVHVAHRRLALALQPGRRVRARPHRVQAGVGPMPCWR